MSFLKNLYTVLLVYICTHTNQYWRDEFLPGNPYLKKKELTCGLYEARTGRVNFQVSDFGDEVAPLLFNKIKRISKH